METGGLFGIISQFEEDHKEGRIPMTVTPVEGYEHPYNRLSVYRMGAPEALTRVFDFFDYDTYGDTQATAPEGVLNPQSPYFGKARDYADMQRDINAGIERILAEKR
jgi:hypothetical protein